MKKSREEYRAWICSIRKRCGMDLDEFGASLCHYVRDRTVGEEVCRPFLGRMVQLWECGQNQCKNIETFLALALVEYCGTIDAAPCISQEERQARYDHVRKRMLEFHGKELYVRNLNHVLLVGAIRGLYSLRDVIDKRKELNERLRGSKLSLGQKRDNSVKFMTVIIEPRIMHAATYEEMEAIIMEHKDYFLGGRVVGERMKKRYGEIHGLNREFGFKEAVCLYAPRFKNSFSHLFMEDVAISRGWLLEFCIRMRMGREEINEVLKDARMEPLSDEKEHTESLIQPYGEMGVGSKMWFAALEQEAKTRVRHGLMPEEDTVFLRRYADIYGLPFHMKVLAAAVSCLHILERNQEYQYPADFYLERILQNGEMVSFLNAFWEECRAYDGEDEDDGGRERWIAGRLLDEASERVYMLDEQEIFTGLGRLKSTYKKRAQDCLEESAPYYRMPEEKGVFLTPAEFKEAEAQYTCAAVLYSIFTGRLWNGRYCEPEPEESRKMKAGCFDLYYFLKALWEAYLDKKPLVRAGEGYRIKLPSGKPVGPRFDDEGITGALMEALAIMAGNPDYCPESFQ